MKRYRPIGIKVLASLTIGLLASSICFATTAMSTQPVAQKTLDNFTHYAIQVQQQWQVPGMAIAIAKGDRIIYAKGFGQRNSQGAPVTANTIFSIASMTKSFTAALLAQQIDAKKYNWDTKVTQLYPAFKLYSAKTTEAFTVRDLIAHNSGLPAEAENALANFGYSSDHTIAALRFIKPVTPFRKTFAYQDIFLEIAKKIIEKYSGASYATTLHQQLFTPLQMNHSYVRTEEQLKTLPNVAQPFVYYAGKVYPYPQDFPYLAKMWALAPGAASGGIKSTAIDMARWLIFNMNNGKIGNRQLISKKNMRFIHTPQTIIKTTQGGNIAQAYAEGWFYDNQSYQPYTVLYHPGGETGMHGLMAYIPQKKIAIVILTNQYTNKVPEALYRRFFDLYLDKKPLKDWSRIYLQQRAKALAAAMQTKTAICHHGQNDNLNKYVGTYYNPVYGNLLLSKQNGQLALTIGPQKITWQLTPCQHNTLKAYWPNPSNMPIPMLSSGADLITFTTDRNNRVNTMTIPFLNDDGSATFIKKPYRK